MQDADMLDSSSLSGQIEILYGGRRMGSLSRVWSAPPLFPQRGIFLIRALVLLRSVCSTGGLLHCCRLFFHKRHTTKTNSGICHSVIHPLPPACTLDTVSAVYNCFLSNRFEISLADQQRHLAKKKEKKTKNSEDLRAVGDFD